MNSRRLLRGALAGHTPRRVGLLLVLLVAALVIVGLVLLSPVALAALNPNGSADWDRLANISQTYAAASAILALLALAGVAISLVLQARELRAARAQAMRMIHMDLLKMAMDDPVYMQAMGPSRFDDDVKRRQSMFVNLFVGYWHMAYRMDEINELQIRASASQLFAGEVGQQFWRTWGAERIRTSADKQARRFHEIVDQEYQAATQPPPPPEPAPAEPEPEPPEPTAQEEPGQESPEPSR